LLGVFRVENHDFTPKNSYFFPILMGGAHRVPPPPPPWIRPWYLGKGFFSHFLVQIPRADAKIVTNKLPLDFFINMLLLYFNVQLIYQRVFLLIIT
jgi:hypothetical protein